MFFFFSVYLKRDSLGDFSTTDRVCEALQRHRQGNIRSEKQKTKTKKQIKLIKRSNSRLLTKFSVGEDR